ncbi:metallophosphoesterase [Candidatus Lokiarchaeum ossiferum]|uniref:metallophosphoesterase n=1 Tax=Candidatus Lokiarchaeum ossiferum TaxID=2951803 RepID=UPI00352E015D
MVEHKKILVISDVHGKIPEMIDFMNMMINTKGEKIDFAVHLGDFWSGRNYDPRSGEQIRGEFQEFDLFKKLPMPLYCLRGNEDLIQPEDVWHLENLWLMDDQEIFKMNDWNVLSIDYQYPGEPSDSEPKHIDYSSKDEIDFIFSHRPPYGILDDTLHFKTHKKLKNTGSPMVRSYYDALKPSLFLFGHFHYSNFFQTDCGLVACLDKLVRLGGANQDEFKYSYALLDPFDQSLEVYWKNRLFFKYSILEQKLSDVSHFDKRNLYFRRRRRK